MNFVLFFNDETAENIIFTGGKGANLAKLTRAGFNVPGGFTVTAEAYKEFIKSAPFIKGDMGKFNYKNPDVLNKQAAQFKEKLAKRPLPPKVEQAVFDALAKAGVEGAYSVRSSSTMEDLSGAAFAGQHDTFLNCVGKEEIAQKVKECFISLWHDRAIAYRQQKGFSQLEATMAVVVQKMVQADSAGVGFSINPVNGNVEQVLINANFGLGESVVSGESNVDQFIVSKKDLRVVDSIIAEKTEVVSSLAQGTKTEKLSPKNALKPSITRKQVKQIALLNIDVEKHYKFPQDIEWAIENGDLYLLQARPITTLPSRWTRDESAERYPNVITPFTWDFVEKGFHISLDHSFKIMGLPLFEGKWFRIFDNYVYGNQNAVWLYMGQNPLVIRDVPDLIGKIPYIKDKFAYVQELPVAWMRDLDTYLLGVGALMAEDLSGRSEQDIWKFITRTTELGIEYFKPNIAISITQSMLYKVFMYILTSLAGPEKGKQLFDALIATNETKTALVNSELYYLAGLVKASEELNAVMHGNSSRQIMEKDLLSAFPEFEKKFKKFLQAHGHREIDLDAYIPTWAEAPNVVLDNIRLIVDTPQEGDPKDKEYEVKYETQKAEAELFAKTPKELHLFLYEVIRLVRAYTSLDDIEHYQTTRLGLPIRKGARALGLLLKKKGIITEEMDIFFAHIDTLEAYINGQKTADELKEEIIKEKEAYLKNKERTPDWILGEKDAAPPADNADVMQGVAGSPGAFEGEVFIVKSTEDFSSFPPKAVLVARTTNPAWTPLFYNAGAVITESGGALSHGAVTAREMKLPAVMSVRDVLRKLKNGQRVRVDGTNGKVYLINA